MPEDTRAAVVEGYGWLLSRIPREVVSFWRGVESAGCRLYLVGGAVRDLLRGLAPKDYDFATPCSLERLLEAAESAGYKAWAKSREFGVAAASLPGGVEVEVTRFRTEEYTRPGRPRVSSARGILEDLSRRDFTVNAMALDLEGRLYDPYGGRRDIEEKVLRFVGDPEQRIREDPLRMLRLLRFAARLGYRIDEASLEAVKRLAPLIRLSAWERIGDEILKAAETNRFTRFVRLLLDTGLARYIIPELYSLAEARHAPGLRHHHGETVLEHTLEGLERLDEVGAPPVVKLEYLLHDIGKPLVCRGVCLGFHGHETAGEPVAEEVARRLRLPAATVKRIKYAVRYHMVPLSYPGDWPPGRLAARILSRYGRETGYDILLLAYADTGERRFLEAAERLLELSREKPKPLVTGYDIMKRYGVPPGRLVGRIKAELYRLQLEEGLETKEEVFRRAEELGLLEKLFSGTRSS